MTIAIRSCSRVSQRRRSRTFFCSRLKKLSMAALSPAAPTRPIDPTMLVAAQGVHEFPATKLRSTVGVQNAAGHLTAAGHRTAECGGGQP